ncbi:MAG: type II secretion system GspH family protein [Candidatus Daviesbacteria bacterium]|nr:type II secretion system GspH family protein [Candidatus Daviesbacteria bacterium]
MRGFTLVEILVVMAIMAIVGTVLVAIFTNTLRGSNKSQILAAIKQNGQAVLDNIDKAMRDADGVVCPKLDDSSNTLVLVKNGRYTRFRFIPSLPGGNGYVQQDSPAPGNDINAFLKTVCTDPSSEGTIILTDTNLRSGVSANWDTGPFTSNREPGFKDSVTVSFKLGPGAGIPPAVANQIDSVVFQTTIQLR